MRTAAINGAAKQVEHHEIAVYGTLEALGRDYRLIFRRCRSRKHPSGRRKRRRVSHRDRRNSESASGGMNYGHSLPISFGREHRYANKPTSDESLCAAFT